MLKIYIFFCVGWPEADFFLLSILIKFGALWFFNPLITNLSIIFDLDTGKCQSADPKFFIFYIWKDFNIIQ